jgi:hypothetical protein
MTVTDQRFMFCIQCAYSVWPRHELGYCAHPDANESITVRVSRHLGACGPDAKLYMEMPNEKTI